MSAADNGGPAFPHKGPRTESAGEGLVLYHHGEESGMSLRDYFAAKAMLGFLACDLDVGSSDTAELVAKGAYLMADAMLIARAA